MSRAASIAKLTRPKLYRVLARDRLFQKMDAAREQPVLWICSPPGAGKTTLVSSYLEARQLPVLWYRMDGGDADPASFFYYLGEAAESVAPRQQPVLPLLTPEYLSDLAGFTRRFFRDFYQRLPPSGVVVFDDYHEVPAGSVLHGVFREALAQIPEGVWVVITSRSEPPGELTRLQLSRALTRLDWDGLRVTLEEARQIASLTGSGPDALAHRTQELWEKSGGWTAGLVLILEHARADARVPAFSPESRHALFQYFANEILARAAPETRHLLLRTAYLPRITVAMAEVLSGDLDAGHRLEGLYQQRLFIDRRDEKVPLYEYHGLFREFLRARVEQSLDETERLLLQRRSARLLETNGWPEEAFPLHADAQDWAATSRIITQLAPALSEQGRWQTLKHWIVQMPAAVVESEPEMQYWLGACELSVNPGIARRALQAAFEGFKARDDVAGQISACAAIIETYYFEWTDFTPLDRWIAALSALLERQPSFASPAAELRARSSLLAAALYRQPHHPRLKVEPGRVLALLEADVPLSRQFTAGTILLNYYCFLGDLDSAERVVGLLRPRLSDPRTTPVNQVWWGIAAGYLRMLQADQAGGAEALERAHQTAREHGLTFIEPAVLAQRVLLALTFGDLQRAQTWLPQIEASVDPARRMDVAFTHLARSWYELLRGRLAAAAKHSDTALGVSFETGAITIQTFCLTARAQLLALAGEHEQACASAHGIRARAASVNSCLLEFHTLLIEAYALLRMGQEAQGLAQLRRGLAIGRQQGYRNTLRWLPKMMSWLLARALDERIEPDYARALIEVRGLRPEAPFTENWPWPVRIHCLGRFSVLIDGAPLSFTGKVQAKPLELLKAIIAAGGRDVAGSSVAPHLWPDAEGDAADNALDITLHRLRKLLRHDDAITVSQGKISLNPHLVWVDVWTFERLAKSLDAGQDPNAAERLLDAYPGNFLEHDGDAPWMLVPRERLRSIFLRQALALGRAWEAAGRLDLAVQVYRRGLEANGLSEELYRRLMVCYQQQGQQAEAIETYRRCRQMLSVVLGVKPSTETESAYRAVTGD